LEIIVEEPSMEALLEALLPRLLGGQIDYAIHSMGSKKQLLAKIGSRFRGYAKWIPDDWRIMVLVDQDRDDCRLLKARLEADALDAGFTTTATQQSREPADSWRVANRVVVKELESWYLGDPSALRTAFPRLPKSFGAAAKLRDPDQIPDTWEALELELQKRGYFQAGLAKVQLARIIAPHLTPDLNRSGSFQVFRRTLQQCLEGTP
jgi:hypothetical protein